MPDGPDIQIGLSTTGADAAAQEIAKIPAALEQIPASVPAAVDTIGEIPKAIEKIPNSTPDAVHAVDEVTSSLQRMSDEAKSAQRDLDVIEAKRRKAAKETGGGILGTDVSGVAGSGLGTAADATGYGKEFRMISSVLSTDALSVAGSFMAIGAAAVASYKALDGTLDRFDKIRKSAAETGQALGPELEIQLEALRETMGPVKTVIDTVGTALEKVWKIAKDPEGWASGANELEESYARAAESLKKLNDRRRELGTDNQSGLTATYNRELDALKQQEATMQRMAALRNELNSIEIRRANRQVDIARQTGGDVELAQANALATELRVGLAGLRDKLSETQQDAEIARTELDSAMVKYGAAGRDGLDKVDPKQFKELSTAYDAAQETYAKANQAVADQKQLFVAHGRDMLEDVETRLQGLQDDSKGTSKAANKARNELYQTVVSEFATISSSTGEVSQALGNERAAAVATIKTLTPQPADTAKVTGAVNEVRGGLEEQGNAFVAALATVSAMVRALADKARAQETQINQLFSRLR
jgi:hypothetical protein